MTASETVLVTGATGNVGSALVPLLVGSGVNTRAMVRDESRAEALLNAGVELVTGDLDRPETIPAALAGVHSVFLLTSNGPTGKQHGLNMVEAARKAGVGRVVKLSGYGSNKSRIIRQHDEIDAALVASGLDYTIVKPTFFMQNTMMAAQTVASDGVVYSPFGDGRVGMIDVRDIAESAHRVLTTDGHIGKTYVLTGPESISFHHVASAMTSVLGKQVSYVAVPPEAGKQAMVGMGMTEWIADGYIELITEFANNWGDRTTDNVELLTGRPARSIEQFVGDFAAVFGGVNQVAGTTP